MKNILLTILIMLIVQGCSSKAPFLNHWKKIEDKTLAIDSFNGEYACQPETSPDWYKTYWPNFFISNINEKMEYKFYHSGLSSYDCHSFTIYNDPDSLVLTFYDQNKTKQTAIKLYNGKDYVLLDSGIKFKTDYGITDIVLGMQTSTNTFLKDIDGNLIIESDSSVTILFWPIPVFFTYWAKFEQITNQTGPIKNPQAVF